MHHPQTLHWLRINRLPGIGPILTRRLLDALGSPEAILNAHPATLASVEGIGSIRANQIVTNAAATLEPARRELEESHAQGMTLLTWDDADYPTPLKHITDPPLILYVKGRLFPTDTLAIGIVGARECTLYGREQSARFGQQLAERGITVVSGGARGIDTAAHNGALRAGGRTLVVFGCGIGRVYPPENAKLYESIVAEDRGAVISELPFDSPPAKENFPTRNRIIAGLSLGILVVEANLKSGSLITARLAAADYGREVFALPGRVDSAASAGTHHLLKAGMATLVESADDILENLGDAGQTLLKAAKANATREALPPTTIAPLNTKTMANPTLFGSTQIPAGESPPIVPPTLTPIQQQIIVALRGPTNRPLSIDDLLNATGLSPAALLPALTTMELQRLLTRIGPNTWALRR